MFISFEGPDGSGKSTSIKKISIFLKSKNIDFILTKEPGNSYSKESKQIREILTNKESNIPNITEALLFAADRRIHLDKVILPSLKKGKIVLCDRYIDSSLAYQGEGRKLGIEKVRIINEIATDKKYPDLTIFFDIKPTDSKQRVEQRAPKDRIELIGNEFNKRVYEGYLKLKKIFPNRIISIDASKNKEEVFQQVKEIIIKKLKL